MKQNKQVTDFLVQFEGCLASEPAFCTAVCPFHLDVRAFTERVEQGRIRAAYSLYREATGFPGIVSRLCERPCEDVCPLRDAQGLGGGSNGGAGTADNSSGLSAAESPASFPGGAIRLREIECAVCDEAGDTAPESYNLPPRGKRVAVVGAGLCGLGCALRLAQKKYDVALFEARAEVGGSGWESEELRAAALREIERQFENMAFALHTGARVASYEDLVNRAGCGDRVSKPELSGSGFDAVFVCTGEDGEAFGLQTKGDVPYVLPRGGGEAFGLNKTKGQTKGDVPYVLPRRDEAGTVWFAGGALTGRTGIEALAHGLRAAAAIDACLRTGNLIFPEDSRETKMVLAPLKQDNGDGSTCPDSKSPWAAANLPSKANVPPESLPQLTNAPSEPSPWHTCEAARCLRCRCDACMLYADLPAYTGKWPQRIRDEVFATTLPGKSEVKATPARRLINMDNLSGVFETVCPAGIDLDGLLLAGRQSLHRQEKMPWAFHEFHLRDMEHADSDRAALVLDNRQKDTQRNTPRAHGGSAGLKTRTDKPSHCPADKPAPVYAFFPGCQLGASQPELVLAVWGALIKLEGAVTDTTPAADDALCLAGLILRCCGAPALWSGDEALFEEKLAGIRDAWESLGRPTLLLACPSCMRLFEEHLPEIGIRSVYEVLAGSSAPALPAIPPLAVFDACAAARLSPERSEALRAGVRALAAAAGLETRELPLQVQITRCCGFGGQPDLASPDFARRVTEDRAAESELPYLCYCSNCRDAFLKAGKPALHVLELLAGAPDNSPAGPENSPAGSERSGEPQELFSNNPLPAGFSQRRENRERLKAALLSGSSEAAIAGQQARHKVRPLLSVSEKLLAQMEHDHILMEDACAAYAHLKETGDFLFRPETGERTGCAPIGRTTLWISWEEPPDCDAAARIGAADEPPDCDAAARIETATEPPGVTLTGAYTHRIAFVPEAVWNAVRRWTPPTEQSAPPGERLICARHQAELIPMEAEFSYLGRSFRHPVLRCPVCGLPYVSEELARGRMREVEMTLEEK